jgi:hypothetical protein
MTVMSAKKTRERAKALTVKLDAHNSEMITGNTK